MLGVCLGHQGLGHVLKAAVTTSPMVVHGHHAEEHPDELRLVEYYGAVDTTWVVYGGRKRFEGDVIGMRAPWLFAGRERSLSTAGY